MANSNRMRLRAKDLWNDTLKPSTVIYARILRSVHSMFRQLSTVCKAYDPFAKNYSLIELFIIEKGSSKIYTL